MERDYLALKRASASRPSGEWNDDDFDVLADGIVVGRIFKANASPVGASWMWTLAFGHHEDRSPTHGYAETREAAMTAFAKSRRWETKKRGLSHLEQIPLGLNRRDSQALVNERVCPP
jgi:hypothetical protein